LTQRRNKRKKLAREDIGVGSSYTNQNVGNHEIDENYSTNDLNSDVDSDGHGVQKWLMFSVEDTLVHIWDFTIGIMPRFPPKRCISKHGGIFQIFVNFYASVIEGNGEYNVICLCWRQPEA